MHYAQAQVSGFPGRFNRRISGAAPFVVPPAAPGIHRQSAKGYRQPDLVVYLGNDDRSGDKASLKEVTAGRRGNCRAARDFTTR